VIILITRKVSIRSSATCLLQPLVFLADVIRELIRSQVPPAKLVLLNPRNGGIEIRQVDRLRPERDTMPVSDLIAIVAIQQDVAPDDEWRLAAMCPHRSPHFH
jgi:hypothetical protein